MENCQFCAIAETTIMMEESFEARHQLIVLESMVEKNKPVQSAAISVHRLTKIEGNARPF